MVDERHEYYSTNPSRGAFLPGAQGYWSEDDVAVGAEARQLHDGHVLRFYKAKELVVYTCAGTLATAKTCLQLPQHRCFVGFDMNLMFFEDSLPSVVKFFAR